MFIVENLCKTMKSEGYESLYSYRIFDEDFYGRQAYGIEIERQDMKEGKIINIERDSISRISTIEERVRNLLYLVYKNNVSPIHLIDILGEYVDKYVSDFNF